MKHSFLASLSFLLFCMSLFGETDYQNQLDVRFYTNLPENIIAPGQLFVATVRFTASGSPELRLFRSETGLKPAEPFLVRTESDCSEGCEVNLILEAGNQVATLSFWLDIESQNFRTTRAIQVSVDATAPNCPAPSFTSCDCGTSIEAGCPFQRLDSGKSLRLLGAVDHPDFDSEAPPTQSYEWSVLPYSGFDGVEVVNSTSLIDAELSTPPVVTPTPILLELQGTINGCACSDKGVVVLESSQSHVDLRLEAHQTAFRLTQGDRITHDFVIKNRGTTAAADVSLEVPFPDSFEVVELMGDVQCSSDESHLFCDMATIPGSSERTLNVQTRVTRTGEFSIEGRVASSKTELTPEDNQLALEFTILPWLPDLIFPLSLGAEAPFPSRSFVGISLFNTALEAVDVEFTTLNESGNRLTTSLLSDVTGSLMPPGSQQAFIAGDLVNRMGGNLLAVRSNDSVEGFSLFGDYQQTRLDGFPVGLNDATRLILPAAIQGPNQATRVYLFNPDTDQTTGVVIRLFDGLGQLIAEKSVELPPLASLSDTLRGLFGVSAIDGYMEITSDLPIRGFEVSATESSLTGIPAQIASSAPEFMIPHFFVSEEAGGGQLRIVNAGVSDAVVTVRGYRDDGSLIGGSILNLPARRLLTADAENLLFASKDFQTGYLRIEIEGSQTEGPPPQVAGAISFSTSGGDARASLPLSVPEKTTFRFLQVAQSTALGIFTGLAILNPKDEIAEIIVRVFDKEGNESAERIFELQGKHRVLGLLPEILEMSDFSQVGGHIEVTADSPFVSFALFGDFSQKYLAAVEGQ